MELNQIGVTPRKEAQFKKRGIESVEDLLRCYPKEYRDYRVPVSVRTLKDRQDERAAVLGIVTGCRILQGKHAMVRLKDKDGGNISAVWFNQAFRVRQVVLGVGAGPQLYHCGERTGGGHGVLLPQRPYPERHRALRRHGPVGRAVSICFVSDAGFV